METKVLRELLMQAAAMAVVAERENRYAGAGVIAEAILSGTPEALAWRDRFLALRSEVESLLPVTD
jgi:hypothetical protein